MSTLPELSFDWSLPCGELPEDSMGRADHARNLTRLLIDKGRESSYVLNLNAKWGTGKTYFLRRWVEEIKPHFPTVYIDAWSSDHSSDPLLSVVSEVKKTLHALLDISELEAELFQGVAKAVKAAAPAVVKAVLKGQLKKWVGVNADDLSEFMGEDDLADTGARLVEEAINAHNESTQGVIKIKESIQDWLSSVVHTNTRQYPLFIFIDELDRCRPTYAIEMLETIKHIFDMKNVVFVVATDRDQLQHSIRAIYGVGFDSRLYLDRFFTRTVTLNNPSRKDFIARKLRSSGVFTDYIMEAENFAYLPSDEGREHDMIFLLAGIADGFDWPLRQVHLWLDRLEAALIMNEQKLEIILLSFMMALETDSSDWLRRYTENISIFPVQNDNGNERIRFRSFMITTRWSFSMFRGEINQKNIPYPSSKLEVIHDSEIGLLEFVKSRLAALKTPGADSFKSIQTEYDTVNSGRELTRQQYHTSTSQNAYPNAAMSIHSYFNARHHTTLNHYIEICRYSSLMS